MLSWIALLTGILCEIAGTTGMRALNESHPALSQASATAGIVISYFCVSRAVEKIPMGIAYAVWSGLGTGGISLLSMLLFAEPMPPLKVLGIALVIAGMIVINTETKKPARAKKADSRRMSASPAGPAVCQDADCRPDSPAREPAGGAR